MDSLRKYIRDIPDFPKPGVVFKDITPLLLDATAFKLCIDSLVEQVAPLRPSKVVAIESRGFIFGPTLAYHLSAGLVIVRKPGKLPFQRAHIDYALEYGTDRLEMHVDCLSGKDSVIIVDDILATGGTAEATARLVQNMGATVSALVFLSELDFLKGRDRLKDYRVISLVRF